MAKLKEALRQQESQSHDQQRLPWKESQTQSSDQQRRHKESRSQHIDQQDNIYTRLLASQHSDQQRRQNESRSQHSDQQRRQNESRSQHSDQQRRQNESRSQHSDQQRRQNESRSQHSDQQRRQNESRSQTSDQQRRQNESWSQHSDQQRLPWQPNDKARPDRSFNTPVTRHFTSRPESASSPRTLAPLINNFLGTDSDPSVGGAGREGGVLAPSQSSMPMPPSTSPHKRRTVILPSLGVDVVHRQQVFLNDKGEAEQRDVAWSRLKLLPKPQLNPLRLTSGFRSCVSTDERPLMPALRDKYGSPRYPEPLMAREATSWLDVWWEETKDERKTLKWSSLSSADSKRDEEVYVVRGVPIRKKKVLRGGFYIGQEYMIVTIFQVGMGGRVFCAAREDGFYPRYFEVEAYHPDMSRSYRLDVPIDQLIPKMEDQADFMVVKPGQKRKVILEIMDMLYFVDKDDPKRKRLALSAISQKVDRYAPVLTPPDALSPRSRARCNKVAQRTKARRNDGTLACVGRQILQQHFRITVSVRSCFGLCFYVVCYLHTTCFGYTLALPFALMPEIWPEYPGIERDVEQWDQEFRRGLACDIAQKVRIKRVTTKFDGDRCTAHLGFKHGLFGPVIEKTILFKEEVKKEPSKFKPKRFGLKGVRSVIRAARMKGPAGKVGGGLCRFGTTTRHVQFTMLKTRAGFMYNGAEMAEINLSLYFPDNSESFDVSFYLSDAALFFMHDSNLLQEKQARALAIRVIKERLSVVGESRADKRVVLNRRVLHRAMMLKIVPEDQAGTEGNLAGMDMSFSSSDEEEEEEEEEEESEDEDESKDSDESTSEEEEEKKPQDWMIKERLKQHNEKKALDKALMMVSVLLEGQKITFQAYDPHPMRRAPPLYLEWCDRLSAVLVQDMMKAPPEQRVPLMNVNLSGLQLLRAKDGRLKLNFTGAAGLLTT